MVQGGAASIVSEHTSSVVLEHCLVGLDRDRDRLLIHSCLEGGLGLGDHLDSSYFTLCNSQLWVSWAGGAGALRRALVLALVWIGGLAGQAILLDPAKCLRHGTALALVASEKTTVTVQDHLLGKRHQAL